MYPDLWVHDLVGGIVTLQTRGPSALHLTRQQALSIAELMPQIRSSLLDNPLAQKTPGLLETKLRPILTTEQKESMRNYRLKGQLQWSTDATAVLQQFEAAVHAAAISK